MAGHSGETFSYAVCTKSRAVSAGGGGGFTVIVCVAFSRPMLESVDTAAMVKSNDCAAYPVGTAASHVKPSADGVSVIEASLELHPGVVLPPFDGVLTAENDPVCPG